MPEIEASTILEDLNLINGNFVLMTMHRPATVDSKEGLELLFSLLQQLNPSCHIVFPIHPRTRKNIAHFGLENELQAIKNLILTEPLDYFSFQKLIKKCSYILTDSGGIQEESTQRGIPCLTLRPNTERPVTITLGTNTLVPFTISEVLSLINSIQEGTYKEGQIPPLWDGKATERVIEVLKNTIH